MAGGIKDDRYTYDLPAIDGGPRRPSLDDLGGDEMVDEDPAPQKYVEPTAALANGVNRVLAGLTRINGTVRIWVEFGTGSPVIPSVRTMGTLLSTGSFTPLSSSAGVTTIEWQPNTLPPMENQPVACLNDGPGMIHAKRNPLNVNQIIVSTFNAAGTPTNLDFSVEIH